MPVNIPFFNMGLHELYPLFCGCEDCSSGHSFGPAVRDHYLVHYVRSGSGRFSYSGHSYTVTRGQCFLICPGEIAFYEADSEQPWHYTWFAFSGGQAEKFVRLAELCKENPIIDSDRVAAVFEDLYSRIMDKSLGGEGNGLIMTSLMFAFFAALSHVGPVESQRDLYIRKARNYVARMYQNSFSVAQLADFCGLDRHYLCRIFKAETGFTLQEYIIRQKMRKAKELLLTSALSVGDVARSVGYTDVYNFSKMFKKLSGVSPLALRQSAANKTDAGQAP